jgi:hypothetical protein
MSLPCLYGLPHRGQPPVRPSWGWVAAAGLLVGLWIVWMLVQP